MTKTRIRLANALRSTARAIQRLADTTDPRSTRELLMSYIGLPADATAEDHARRLSELSAAFQARRGQQP